MPEIVTQEYRRDGWPFCPRCTNDELYSTLMMGWNGDDPRPSLSDCFEHEFDCYFCGFHGRIDPQDTMETSPNA